MLRVGMKGFQELPVGLVHQNAFFTALLGVITAIAKNGGF